MKMNFKCIPIAVLGLLCMGFSGCIIEHRETPIVERAAWGIPPANQTVTATANGWNENGVTVTITLVNGIITNLVIDASGESPGFRDMGPAIARPIIEASNSFHIPSASVDGATGATATLRGIVRAGSMALLLIDGVEEEDLDWYWGWLWTEPPPDEEMG